MKAQRNLRGLGPALLAVSAIGLGSLLAQDGALAQAGAKLEDKVLFTMPGGPAQDTLKECVAKGFTKEFNVQVEFLSMQHPQALARVLVQRNAPSIDVIWTDDGNNFVGFREGVLTNLTPAMIPNMARIDPKFGFKPGEGALVTTSIQGITYNTKLFQEKGWAPPKSFNDFFDPKHKGHVGIFGLGAGSGQGLLAAAGFVSSGDPLNFDAGFAYLTKLKPTIYTIFQQAPQYGDALLNGSIHLGFGPAPRHLAMKLQGDPIGFVQPVEGIISKELYLQIVKGAPHPNAAAAFVNWMLSAQAQSCMLKAGYSPVVEGVEVDPELASFLKVQQKVIPVNWEKFQENLPALLRRWNKEIDG